MQVREIVKKQKNKSPPEKSAEMLKKARKEFDVLVKGMFEFLDAQGGWLDFCYRFFPGEPVRQMRLVHGEICELPMGLVKHLNNTKKKIRRLGDVKSQDSRGAQIALSGRGVPSTYETVSRIRFTPTDVL